MTTAQLRFIANIRKIWKLIDWQTVGEIAWEGLKLTIALTIVCGMYTVEGVQKSYNWLQPRLANLLQHPQQTITKGPAFLYAECVEDVLFSDDSTILQRMIVTVVSEFQTICENVTEFVEEIKYSLSTFNVRLYGTNLRLQWGSINYSLVAFKSGNLYIRGQRMI